MRISTEWLQEFVELPETEALAHTFEMAGIGVEELDGENFTLEVTSNRGDCLSVVGLAREVAAMTGATLRDPAHAQADEEPLPADRLRVTIEDPSDCARYLGRLIEGVRLGQSPEWMQRRLLDCGMRPVNNVVDITNYVMLELGQPMHAFDADKVASRHIRLRRALAGERIVTLDGQERELDPEMLLVTDGEKPIAIAGVMGGLDSEVTEATTRVILESAHFAPSRVYRAAHGLSLQSEASRRFERYVDPQGVAKAASRASQLLREIAGGTIVPGAVDCYPAPAPHKIVSVRPARCNGILGIQLEPAEIARLLGRLGFDALECGEELIRVTVPSWRSDIERDVDLIEEVARIHGYDHIPIRLPRGANPAAGRSLPQRLEEGAKAALLRAGLQEIVTVSLVNAGALAKAGLDPDMPAVPLRNPVTEDATHLRASLLPGLLETLGRNAGRPARLFEVGKIYTPRPGESQPREHLGIGIALLDAPAAPHWKKAADTIDFFTLKALVDVLLGALGAPEARYRASREGTYHPGRCAVVELEGEELGYAGEVHPAVAARYGLATRAYAAVLDFDALVRHLTLRPHYAPAPRFPPVERDLALLLKVEVPAADVQAVIRESGGPLLQAVQIFDIYTGAPVPEGEKNVALSLRFRADDRTLRDEEINQLMEAINGAAANRLGAKLRS